MEAQSQVLWDFFSLAYRRGLIDELMQITGRMMDPDAELGDFLSQMEDGLAGADFTPFERLWEGAIHPALATLNNAEAIDALLALLKILRPVLDIAAENRAALTRTLHDATALKPQLAALMPAFGTLVGAGTKLALQGDAGRHAGNAVNKACQRINTMNAQEPELIRRFFAGLLAAIDPQAFRRATDTILGAFLDQRPRVLGWTFGTVATRLKKRFGRADANREVMQ